VWRVSVTPKKKTRNTEAPAKRTGRPCECGETNTNTQTFFFFFLLRKKHGERRIGPTPLVPAGKEGEKEKACSLPIPSKVTHWEPAGNEEELGGYLVIHMQ
jgi:hypothetical protein